MYQNTIDALWNVILKTYLSLILFSHLAEKTGMRIFLIL